MWEPTLLGPCAPFPGGPAARPPPLRPPSLRPRPCAVATSMRQRMVVMCPPGRHCLPPSGAGPPSSPVLWLPSPFVWATGGGVPESSGEGHARRLGTGWKRFHCGSVAISPEVVCHWPRCRGPSKPVGPRRPCLWTHQKGLGTAALGVRRTRAFPAPAKQVCSAHRHSPHRPGPMTQRVAGPESRLRLIAGPAQLCTAGGQGGR